MPRGGSRSDLTPYSYSKSLPYQKRKVAEAVSPWHEFLLADPLGVADKDFAKPDVFTFDSFDLDFLAECHAVTDQLHLG